MLDKIIKNFQEASVIVKEKASSLGHGAKEKSAQMVDDWLGIFPELLSFGFEMTSFAVGYALSPSINVELKGNPEQFTKERLTELIEQHKGKKTLNSVLGSIKSTIVLYEKMDIEIKAPLIIKIRIKITPEIKVYFGIPIVP